MSKMKGLSVRPTEFSDFTDPTVGSQHSGGDGGATLVTWRRKWRIRVCLFSCVLRCVESGRKLSLTLVNGSQPWSEFGHCFTLNAHRSNPDGHA